MIFLIEYDRRRGELVTIEAFDDVDRAAAENARLSRELKLHERGIRHEVVLLQAGSEDALHETHRRYFVDIATLAEAETISMTESSSSTHSHVAGSDRVPRGLADR